jgi:hypothetical protein
MSLSESFSNSGTVSTVTYGTDLFPRAAEEFRTVAQSDRGGRVVFVGGVREERQAALATLTRHTTETVHQFRLPTLLSERRMQTQNGFRKAFDHAAEEGAMLYFDRVDDLFDHEHSDPLEDEGFSEPTAAEYFFDRMEAYTGVVVLGMQSDLTANRVKQYDINLIVRFDQ